MKLSIPVALLIGFLSSVLSEPSEEEPELKIMARPSLYNIGEQKAIYCKGKNMKESIDWYDPTGAKVELKSHKNTRVFVEHRDSNSLTPLIIQKTEVTDTGNWTCRSGDYEETIRIVVGERVKFEKKVEKITGETGKSVTLNCVAKGYPMPKVQWYKDTQQISENTSSSYILRNDEDRYQLEIRVLNYQDTGEYMCKVTQEALSYYTDKRFQLSVLHQPFMYDIETGYVQNLVNSSHAQVMEVYAILNETKNISCCTVANPPASYEWTRRHNGYDSPIREEDTIFTAEDRLCSVMMLRLYSESDLGVYTCSARNTKGKVTILYDVSLGNKPDPPTSVELTFRNSTDLEFNVSCVTCNFDHKSGISEKPNNLTVIGYSFQLVPVVKDYTIPDWEKSQNYDLRIDDTNGTLFIVGNLSASTTYYGRVRTKNAAGFSDWLPIDPNPATTDDATIPATIMTVMLVLAAIATFV